MSKPVYKVMDSKGRVLIPRELRLAAGMCGGDILALQLQEGKVSVRKVEIVEVGDQSPEAVEAYVRAAIKTKPDFRPVRAGPGEGGEPCRIIGFIQTGIAWRQAVAVL